MKRLLLVLGVTVSALMVILLPGSPLQGTARSFDDTTIVLQLEVTPATDAGKFNLSFVNVATNPNPVVIKLFNVGHGTTSDPVEIPDGSHVASISAAAGTDLASYTTGISCHHNASISSFGTLPFIVGVGEGEHVVCTFNVRKAPPPGPAVPAECIAAGLPDTLEGYDQVVQLTAVQSYNEGTDFAKKRLVLGGSGDNVITVNGGGDCVDGGPGNDTIKGSPSLSAVTVLIGGDGNDQLDISTSSAPGHLYGGKGDDTLKGSKANDLLVGGEGKDILIGNAGNDECVDLAAPANTFLTCENIHPEP